MIYRILIIIVVVLVLVIAGIGLSYKNNTSKVDSNNNNNSSTPTVTATRDESADVQTFNVEAGSFYFKPNEIKVKKGDKVKIILSNNENMQHDWALDKFDVKSRAISGGLTDTVEFVASESGTFEYYCSIGLHRSYGQVGKLIVE